MKDSYIYAGKPSRVKDASSVSGVLTKLFGGGFAFRVYDEKNNFVDYEICHDDLSITINADELASFYSHKDQHVLDHSPKVLGLKKVGS